MNEVPNTRVEQIIAAGRRLLEDDGPDGLSMRNVAAEVGIRAPSLYEHIADKRALEDALVVAGLTEMGDVMAEAAEGAEDPLLAVALAWRAWASAHPHLYRLVYGRPLHRHIDAVAAADRQAGVTIRRLTDDDLVAARSIWAFAHGMVLLELNGRFPPDAQIDQQWHAGIGALRTLIP